MAPQCTGMKRPPARPDKRWSAAATSSLPVPLSPEMRTVASVGATRRMISKIASMLGCWPMIPSKTPSSSVEASGGMLLAAGSRSIGIRSIAPPSIGPPSVRPKPGPRGEEASAGPKARASAAARRGRSGNCPQVSGNPDVPRYAPAWESAVLFAWPGARIGQSCTATAIFVSIVCVGLRARACRADCAARAT